MSQTNQYVVLIIYAALLLILVVFAVAMHLLVAKHKARSYKVQLQQAAQKFESELLKAKLELQEEVFLNVSGEIHDNVGQVLSSIALNLQCITNPCLKEKEKSIINLSIDRIHSTTNDLKHLSRMLNGSSIEKIGLVEAIKRELMYLRLNDRLNIHFTHPEKKEMPVLSGSQVLLLFRIAQEAIQNTIRHADATQLIVEIGCTIDKSILEMKISDNGIGLPNNADSKSGMGLLSIRERAKMLSAEIEIGGRPSFGCVVALSLKL